MPTLTACCRGGECLGLPPSRPNGGPSRDEATRWAGPSRDESLPQTSYQQECSGKEIIARYPKRYAYRAPAVTSREDDHMLDPIGEHEGARTRRRPEPYISGSHETGSTCRLTLDHECMRPAAGAESRASVKSGSSPDNYTDLRLIRLYASSSAQAQLDRHPLALQFR